VRRIPPSPSFALYSDEKRKSESVTLRGFGWGIAHGAVTRRPPVPLDTMVARTHMHTHAVGVWDLSIVQGPVSVAPWQNPNVYDSQRLHRL
jgi:hypothetical protein